MKAEAPIAARRRPQPGRGGAIALAIGVHVAFLALIVFGVRWQSMPTPPVAADLWDKLPAKSSPPPPAPKPTPVPPKPEPAPAPKVEPKPEPAPPPKVEPKPEQVKPAPPPRPDPAIAEKMEREKKAREERERLEQERQEQIRKKEEAAKKKRDEEAAAKKKLEQEQAAKKKREEEQRRREEQRAKEDAERARAAAASARQLEMQKYVDRIKAKILSRANVPDTVANGTEVTVRIRILPGGDVLDIAVTRSASPTYSAAIERAIRSAQPLPVPEPTSELFPAFRDLNLNFRHER